MKTIAIATFLLLAFHSINHAQQTDSLPKGAVPYRREVHYTPLNPFARNFAPVNIAYGEKPMVAVSTAAWQTTQKQLARGQVYQNPQAWQGVLPGVSTVRAGSNPNQPFEVRIRGLRSFQLGAEPLYVIDGIPGLSLSALDPSEITSISVLRDGASAAMYGGRAANGVILLSTRPFFSPGRLTLRYEGQLAYETLADRYEVLGEQEFVGFGGADFSPTTIVNTNWQSLVSRNGISQAHHLSASYDNRQGGWFRAALHFRNNEGVLRSSGFEQYNGSVRFEQPALKGRLKLSGGLSLLGRDANPGFVEAWRYAIVANPSSPVKGGEARFGGYFTRELFDYFNPVAIIEQNSIESSLQYAQGNFQAILNLLPGLDAMVRVGRERQDFRQQEYYSKFSQFRGQVFNGLGIQDRSRQEQDILESTLSYQKKFENDLQVNALGGYAWQRSVSEGLNIQAGNIISDALGSNNVGSFLDLQRGQATVSSFKNARRTIGIFGRAALNWDNTVFVEGGLRRDGASTLGRNARWGNFPFASAGVDVKRWVNTGAFTLMKLRGGIGLSGQAPGVNRFTDGRFNSFSGNNFFTNGNYNPVLLFTQERNDNLGFERTREFNAGFDLNFYDKFLPLWLSFDWFSYRSTDLLVLQDQMPNPLVPFPQWTNSGSLKGNGMELTLGADLIKRKNLQWNIGVVLQQVRTRVSELGQALDSVRIGFPGSPCGCDVTYQLLYEGGQVGSFWGPISNGSLNSAGQFSFQDLNKDGFVDIFNFQRDQTLLGRSTPKMELGIRSNLQWNRFSVNALLRGAFGHTLAHEYRLFYESVNPSLMTWNKVVTSYFNEDNRSNNIVSNLVLENATFVRLQYLALAYNIPLPEQSGVRNLQVELGANNLLTLTGYTGLDPELRLSDQGPTDNGARIGRSSNPILSGIDRRNTYPLAKVFWLGVKAEF